MEPRIASLIAIESLQVHMIRQGELRLCGTLRTVSAQDELVRHIGVVHDHIVAKKYSTFTIDVRELSFVNSSAIRVFVNWISLADQARYKLVFLTDGRITWHRLSFSVLKSLSPTNVEIRDVRAAAGESA